MADEQDPQQESDDITRSVMNTLEHHAQRDEYFS